MAPLARKHGVTLDTADPNQLATAADTLIGRLEETRAQISEREQTLQQESQQRQRLEQLEQRRKSAAEDLAELLTLGGADDAEEFRRRAAQYTQRQELVTRRDERLGSLSRLSGPDDRLAAFKRVARRGGPRPASQRVQIAL